MRACCYMCGSTKNPKPTEVENVWRCTNCRTKVFLFGYLWLPYIDDIRII